MGIEDINESGKSFKTEAIVVSTALAMVLGGIAVVRRYKPQIEGFDLHEGLDSPDADDPSGSS